MDPMNDPAALAEWMAAQDWARERISELMDLAVQINTPGPDEPAHNALNQRLEETLVSMSSLQAGAFTSNLLMLARVLVFTLADETGLSRQQMWAKVKPGPAPGTD